MIKALLLQLCLKIKFINKYLKSILRCLLHRPSRAKWSHYKHHYENIDSILLPISMHDNYWLHCLQFLQVVLSMHHAFISFNSRL